MTDFTLTNPAYNKIINSELIEEIRKRKQIVERIGRYREIYNEENKKIINQLKTEFINDKNGITPERIITAKFLEEVNEIHNSDNYLPHELHTLFYQNPTFISYLAIGKELAYPEKYGFSSINDLATAINLFCISEQEDYTPSCMKSSHIWRNQNFKNEIHCNIHGDLSVSQVYTGAEIQKIKEKTLFGKIESEKFKIYTEYRGKGFGAYQDWTYFLLSLLKYAEICGKSEIPEIKNWEEVLEANGGGHGTATTECMCGDGHNILDLEMLLSMPLITENTKLDTFPLRIPYPRSIETIPYVKEGKLLFLKDWTKLEKDPKGISLKHINERFFDDKKLTIVVEYGPEDIAPAVLGNLLYFARDRTKMKNILNEWNKGNRGEGYLKYSEEIHNRYKINKK